MAVPRIPQMSMGACRGTNPMTQGPGIREKLLVDPVPLLDRVVVSRCMIPYPPIVRPIVLGHHLPPCGVRGEAEKWTSWDRGRLCVM